MSVSIADGEAIEGQIACYQASRDAKLRDRIVRQSLWQVRHIARSFRERVPGGLDDLEQVGAIGLLNAIERFEPTLGRSFEPYAGSLITGEMRHYLRDHGQLVRPPRELFELRARVFTAHARLEQELGRDPTTEELAHALKLDVPKVLEVLALETGTRPLSLDMLNDDEEGRGRPQLVDTRYRSFQLAAEDRMMLAAALGKLRHVSREVIEFAFYQDLTQTEIAQRLGISQMQVSRRLSTATKELWKILNTKLW
ncbi:RNA polymerase sigma factor SigF [compost metagenome]